MGMSVSLASWRWQNAITNATLVVLAIAVLMLGALSSAAVTDSSTVSVSGSPSLGNGTLAQLAASRPAKRVEVIVQLERGTDAAAGRKLISGAGGKVTRDLRLINGFGAKMSAAAAAGLQDEPGVRAVSINARVEKSGVVDPAQLVTSFNASMRSEKAWSAGYTGKGVGVAVIDTGIAGDLPDFQVSETDTTSRVIANVVVNPSATTPGDGFGHGTHIAGLIAGNGTNRTAGDPLRGKYAGVAPEANLINVKASDEDGNVDVIDVIDGLQFVVDHKDDYNIRVVNLSLNSTVAESYRTDPLDAAV
jgi:serine protease AprX